MTDATVPTNGASAAAGTPPGPLLELREVDVFYGRVQALRGVSLSINEGEIVALIGSNGAGKTTTLRLISGLNRPAKGEVRLRGEAIHTFGAERIARMGVGHAPEGRRLFPRMTVQENLDMGAYARRDRAGIRTDFERVFTLFPRLRERKSQLAGSLSGGEQQMVAIGRALMSAPSILLLDEPSLGLAPILVDSIFEVIREINAKGTTILLIEQNALLALNTASRGYVLETGSVALSGSSDELLTSADVQRAYLGM
jgi:branched-chain amino acid transport system ATP-binding protein